MPRIAATSAAVLALALVTFSAGVTAQNKGTSAEQAAAACLPALIWQDPGDAASLDLRYGAGGKAHEPDPAGTYTFVSEDLDGWSPKFEVVDGQGIGWKVKVGDESRSETAATRFLWAAGYFVDEDYTVAEFTVKGLPTLHRGESSVTAGGIVHDARLERKRPVGEKLGDWNWFDNPFTGQRELNGLRVMMSLINNWDLKQDNNSIYVVDGGRRYAVSDLGAAFGKTGRFGTQSKGVPSDYSLSKFIAKDSPDRLNFVMHSRPLFYLWLFAPNNYDERTKMEAITKHIPRADAQWLGQRLSRLSDEQIRDGFRAAGYESADVEILTATIRRRIAALEAL